MLLVFGGFEWFARGGWAMYPLLALSIYTLYVILERSTYFTTRWKQVERDLTNVLHGMKLIPERLEGELAPLLARSLKDQYFDELSVQSAIEHDMHDAAKGVGMLDTIANAGPMFGLIGTVSGMIDVFYKVAAVRGALDVRLLSSGISEALVATWSGLAVALFAYFAYRIFRGKLMTLENRLYTVADDARRLIALDQPRLPGADPAAAAGEAGGARSGQ